jgi:hypothetical protein
LKIERAYFELFVCCAVVQEGAKGSSIGEADIDLMKKMEPLKGQVEWSTWGSKLEMIFSPVFSSLPTLLVRHPFRCIFFCLNVFTSDFQFERI